MRAVCSSRACADTPRPRPRRACSDVAPGQVERQAAPVTGTVLDGSVRLLIGSGAATNRINGRLDGDTLELTIPQDAGAQTRRLTPASQDVYANRRAGHPRRRAATQGRGANGEGTRAACREAGDHGAATEFGKALAPGSSEDPCRYMTASSS